MKRVFSIGFWNFRGNCNIEVKILDNKRLIIYHKQAASARILFFALNGSVCHCDGLPPESKIVDSSIEEDRVVDYSETLIPIISNVTSKDLAIDIYLACFTTVDPPREQLKHLGGKFIPIVEARIFPAIELKLLGLVYSFLMD